MRALRFLLLLLLSVSPISASARSGSYVICAYVFPQGAPLQPGQINPHAVTRINYAFAAISNGRMTLATPTAAEDLHYLTGLRQQNPSLQVLLSVGGWLGSGGFSDAALTEQSRAVFVRSGIDLIRQYNLDGIDIDWEYPGQAGAGNTFRSEDKRNFTLLLQQMRQKLDQLSRAGHRRLYLTIAAGATSDFLDQTRMALVQRSLDAVNLMAYDYYEPGSDKITGNHAPLFTDPEDPKGDSSDASVRAFEAAGVPASKIILAVPFYGHRWTRVPPAHNGLFQTGQASAQGSVSYGVIVGTMLGHGFTRYWDARAQAPWLYSEEQRVFVSYDDPESLKLKCGYVIDHKLGGIGFWSYLDDSTGELLRTIDATLDAGAPDRSRE